MHEINNIDKRRRTIKMFSNYFLVALVVTVLTGVIVLAASGYDIDRSTGQVIQNGILLVETEPRGANVTINGQMESAKTPARYPIPQGRYTVMVDKEGYRSWQSTVEIFGSRVNWIYYPRLVPELINTRPVSSLQNLNFIEHSQQRDSILINPTTNLRSFTLFDLGANQVAGAPFVLPEALYAVNEDDVIEGRVNFDAWSPDGRYVILQHVHSGQVDYIVVDLDDLASSYNLDEALGIEFDSVVFTHDNRLALLQEGLLFTTGVTSPVVAAPVETNVRDIILSSNDTWVETDDGLQINLARLSEPENVLLSSSDLSTDYAVSVWEGDLTLIQSNSANVRIYKDFSTDPSADNVVSKILSIEENFLVQPSPDGRFVLAAGSSDSLIYDQETLETYEVAYGVGSAIQWLDGYRLAYSLGGQLYISDFNGSNEYQIASYDAGYPAVVDEDFTAIYSVDLRDADGQLILRESSLELE